MLALTFFTVTAAACGAASTSSALQSAASTDRRANTANRWTVRALGGIERPSGRVMRVAELTNSQFRSDVAAGDVLVVELTNETTTDLVLPNACDQNALFLEALISGSWLPALTYPSDRVGRIGSGLHDRLLQGAPTVCSRAAGVNSPVARPATRSRQFLELPEALPAGSYRVRLWGTDIGTETVNVAATRSPASGASGARGASGATPATPTAPAP